MTQTMKECQASDRLVLMTTMMTVTLIPVTLTPLTVKLQVMTLSILLINVSHGVYSSAWYLSDVDIASLLYLEITCCDKQ